MTLEGPFRRLWLYRLVCLARQVFFNCGIGNLTDTHKLLFAALFPFAIGYGTVMNVVCRGKAARRLKGDLLKTFEDEVSVVAILKNEAPYVREWVEYHRLIGVTRFYIYDNGSQDHVREVLADYIDAGLVVYRYFPDQYQQNIAYTDAIRNYAPRTKFMAVVDLDEFIVPVDENVTLGDVVTKIVRQKPYAAGVTMRWVMYGSSHHEKRPDGLVIDNYVYRAPDSFMLVVKTVFNPRVASGYNNPHYPIYKYGAYSVNENGHVVIGKYDTDDSCRQIRINHYFTKSQDEFRAKIARGTADKYLSRRPENFGQWDRNDVYDGIMSRYSPQVRDRLRIASECRS